MSKSVKYVMMGERKRFMKIIDDYLTESECKFICLNTINSVHFPLHLMQSVSGNDNHDGIFFTHKFVENNQPNSNCLGMIINVIHIIQQIISYLLLLDTMRIEHKTTLPMSQVILLTSCQMDLGYHTVLITSIVLVKLIFTVPGQKHHHLTCMAHSPTQDN